eukprot:CAMPEP_0183520622 /NCGR_PEP_ID=MMETSP0371-20130417/17066_1 /TAXON_ID=268820 /ORGANISM="Peridinium aciculiferum, Strain PAER-2" /LENGTH=237 /DNA_ID=CAMNT_0025719021 /DNA_START=1 /DNA_END=714 /DNA_ORIENTATION=+
MAAVAIAVTRTTALRRLPSVVGARLRGGCITEGHLALDCALGALRALSCRFISAPSGWTRGVGAAVWPVQRLGPLHSFQIRTKIVVPEKKLTKKVSRSSGPGGQSVNVSDTRVQLSFTLDKADWIPVDIREKMKVLHKNRISKLGEISVACQVADSQLQNTKNAVEMIYELIAQAEKAFEDDQWQSQKMEHKDWVIEKMKRDGREKELEKKQEAVKNMKDRSRERSREKKMDKINFR